MYTLILKTMLILKICSYSYHILTSVMMMKYSLVINQSLGCHTVAQCGTARSTRRSS